MPTACIRAARSNRELRLGGIALRGSQHAPPTTTRAVERFKAEQQEFEAKQAKRKVQRDAGKKPRGKEPEPPEAVPKGSDQVNLTDEESRITPVDGKGADEPAVQRLHIIDACQASDLPESYKYERNWDSGEHARNIRDGVSLELLFHRVEQTVNKAVARMTLLR